MRLRRDPFPADAGHELRQALVVEDEMYHGWLDGRVPRERYLEARAEVARLRGEAATRRQRRDARRARTGLS